MLFCCSAWLFIITRWPLLWLTWKHSGICQLSGKDQNIDLKSRSVEKYCWAKPFIATFTLGAVPVLVTSCLHFYHAVNCDLGMVNHKFVWVPKVLGEWSVNFSLPREWSLITLLNGDVSKLIQIRTLPKFKNVQHIWSPLNVFTDFLTILNIHVWMSA